METEGKVLVVKRIHVVHHLRAAPEHREVVERVHGFHAEYCPVARTLRGCVEITTELRWEEEGEA